MVGSNKLLRRFGFSFGSFLKATKDQAILLSHSSGSRSTSDKSGTMFNFLSLIFCLQGAAGLVATPSFVGRGSLGSAPLVSPDTSGIVEEACLDAAAKMRRLPVPVSTDIHPDGEVGISFVHWPSVGRKTSQVPIFLVHGFDSSCLEYRRLGPLLAAQGIDVYAVDILGWGFTQLKGVKTFGAYAKVEALSSFIASVCGDKPFCILGASLGGAAAIEVASLNEKCQGLVLLDAQGFVDGIGPMASLPTPLAKLGVGVLSKFCCCFACLHKSLRPLHTLTHLSIVKGASLYARRPTKCPISIRNNLPQKMPSTLDAFIANKMAGTMPLCLSCSRVDFLLPQRYHTSVPPL